MARLSTVLHDLLTTMDIKFPTYSHLEIRQKWNNGENNKLSKGQKNYVQIYHKAHEQV